MKQATIVIGLVAIIIIIAITLLSVDGKSTRQNQLNKIVSAAVKQTVKESQIKGQSNINSDKEMVASFIQNMCVSFKSDGDINIEVMGVDYKEGMLDVLVTEKFTYLMVSRQKFLQENVQFINNVSST